MRGLIIAAVLIVAVVAIFAFGLVNINQTKETRLPQVAVQGGQAPAFDVDTAKVDVGTRKASVDVPVMGTKETKIDVPVVGTKKESIDLPTVDVKKAQ